MNAFVVFEHTPGGPQRKLTLVLHPEAETTWKMQVTSEPPASGALLVTFGVHNFGGRFAYDGTTLIRKIPAALLADEDGPELNIAIVPLGMTAVGD